VRGREPDLEQFLEVVAKLMSRHVVLGEPLSEPDRLRALEGAMAEADVLDLAVATFDMDEARRWLADVVRAVAHSSPSVALVLAARYTAHRGIGSALGLTDVESRSTSGVVARLDAAAPCSTVPGLFDPELTLLIDASGGSGVIVDAESTAAEPGPQRTGLTDAHLHTVRVVGEPTHRLEPTVAATAFRDLTLLTAAAALGVAEAASDISSAYAVERRQFGSTLASFAGMRAMLVEMQLRVSTVTALLERAIELDTVESCMELAATAGRAAVDVAIDAIQVHGGYGYIDEYPVAGLLRDALSLRARIARRSSVARLAVERFGAAG